MRPFKINRERSEELERIISLDSRQIEAIVARLNEGEVHLDFEEISEKILKEINSGLAEILTLHISSIAMLSDRPEGNLDDVLSSIRSGLTEYGWTEENLERFDAFKEKIRLLVTHPAFYIGAKAASLFRETSNHLHDFRTVVDARPIFDVERERIDVIILFTTIAFNISEGTGKESQVTVALDEAELTRIRDECDKALRKLRILKGNLESRAQQRVIVYGSRPS